MDMKARSALATLIDLAAQPHEQVGKLETTYGRTLDQDELIECYRCTIKHTRKLWVDHRFSCPFCSRTTLDNFGG